MVWQTERDAGINILDKLQPISDAAKNRIHNPGIPIPPEDFNNPKPARDARLESQRKSEQYNQLSREPLIVALLAETEGEKRRVYYFARRAQVDDIERYFTHLMSPIGPLATCDPGDEYTLPNDQILTVISKFIVTPQHVSGEWDSRPTHIFWDEETPKSIVSLRNYLNLEQVPQDGWGALESEEETPLTSARDALRGTGLRDQAVLDKVQDKIFRLPLSSQLMISGPPGSGKTTTLIRRMAQKNEMSFLTPEEKAVVERVANPDRPHAESWIMFTPTELLEGYLSEAFNREGVPAPKDRVWTWSKFSNNFGREEARLLRTANNSSGFVLDEQARHLSPEAHAAPADWVSRFEERLREEHLNDLRNAADRLRASQQPEMNFLYTRIRGILEGDNIVSIFSVFEEMSSVGGEIEIISATLRKQWRDLIDRRIERFSRLKPDNIKNLDTLVKGIEEASSPIVSEEEIEEEDLELEDRPTLRSRKDRIFKVIRQAVNSQARSLYRTRKPHSKYDTLMDFLGKEILKDEELRDLGRDLEVLSGASRINRACSVYFNSMNSRYRTFRREEAKWYSEKEVSRDKIDRDEFDALILVKLKAVHALLPRVDTDVSFWSALRPFVSKLRNQIYVDEATDFSELQLSAMYHLSHPLVRSFFMSGDFDQRLTEWGVKDAQAIQRAVPNISTRDVEVGYRQSRKLKNFVDLMRSSWLGEVSNSVPPKFGIHEGYEPAMFEAKGNLDAQAKWIADRIHDIERINERLPSIAILVPSVQDVKPLAGRLGELMESIPVTAHEEAGNLGRDEEVRVFPVQHVKGLEFEAAFFVGIDELSRAVPELFQRYLYVGATRAATFLGFAANDKMPPEIIGLGHSFVSAWEG